jgi:hypothetical protein
MQEEQHPLQSLRVTRSDGATSPMRPPLTVPLVVLRVIDRLQRVDDIDSPWIAAYPRNNCDFS